MLGVGDLRFKVLIFMQLEPDSSTSNQTDTVLHVNKRLSTKQAGAGSSIACSVNPLADVCSCEP